MSQSKFGKVNKIKKRIEREFVKHLLPRGPISQPLWEVIYRLALLGMNIGSVLDVLTSGELWVIDFVRRYFPKGEQPIVFDCGAHFGEYAIEVISRLGKKVKLYAFEPSKKSFEILFENLSDYENVHLYSFGLGDKEESVTLYSDVEGSPIASVYKRRLDHFGITMKHTEKVHLRRLDDFCSENAIQRIHLLKLDVEGNELNVLKGAQGMLSSNSIDFIQFEFGGSNIDSRTYFHDFFYMLKPYYTIYRILNNGLSPIKLYKETYEIFLTTNYLAISREIS